MNTKNHVLAAGIAATYLFSGGIAFAANAAQAQTEPEPVTDQKVEEIVDDAEEKGPAQPEGSWFTGQSAEGYDPAWVDTDEVGEAGPTRQSDSLDPDVDRPDENETVTQEKVDEVVDDAKGTEGAQPKESWFDGQSHEKDSGRNKAAENGAAAEDQVSEETLDEVVDDAEEKGVAKPEGSWFTGQSAEGYDPAWVDTDEVGEAGPTRQSDSLDPDVDRPDENETVTQEKVDEVVDDARGTEGAQPKGSWFTGQSAEGYDPAWVEADEAEQDEEQDRKRKGDDKR